MVVVVVVVVSGGGAVWCVSSQEELETVIPAIGGAVRIVNGRKSKGYTGTLQGVDEDAECLSVTLQDGSVVAGLAYDDVCKLDEEMEAKRLAKKAAKDAEKKAKKAKVGGDDA